MKPLYLKAEQPLSIKLDGPALRVSQPEKCCRRFPLSRISRVIVSGPADWATSALLACADAGISVSFLDGINGGMRARFMGRSQAAGILARLWSNFLNRPDHELLLREWRENLQRRAVGFCSLRMGCDPAILLTDTDGIIPVPDAEQSELEIFVRKLDGLIESRLMQELSRYGLKADDDDLLELIPDLKVIVQWALRPDLALWWRKRNRRLNGMEPVVAFFEKFSNTVDFQLRDALHSLYRFLRRFD